MLPALSGASLLYGMGMIDSGIAMCYEQLVLDNEIVHMVRRILKGMAVNEETLAKEVIKAVGPVGNFLGQKHTRTHMRQELSTSSLFDRRMKDAWVRDGAKDASQRAREKARSIFENQKTDPVAPEIAAKLRSIVEAAEEEEVESEKY
jgi:trimethylamine--corrinoid protein Co-methyltransferase